MILQTTVDHAPAWLAKYEALYSEAEARGDTMGMAKALDGTLRTKIAITEGDERQRLVDARCRLVMQIPEAAPSYCDSKSMAKALVPAIEPKAERKYRPRPTAEQALRDRDFAVSMSLIRARRRFAKCVAERDHLGAINAMATELSCESALAKSDASRQHIQQLRMQLYATANEAGFVYSNRGIYRMANARDAAAG